MATNKVKNSTTRRKKTVSGGTVEKKNKGGRPRRFETPEQMKTEIEKFFVLCQQQDKLPLISWIEYNMHFSFCDYERDTFPDKEKFSSVITWAREASKAICEQAAFTGKMSKVAARLYLTCKCGYVNSYKIDADTRNQSSVNIENAFTSLIKKVEDMSEVDKEIYKSRLEEAYGTDVAKEDKA